MSHADGGAQDRRSRDALIAAILGFLSGTQLLPLDHIRRALEREIDDAGRDAVTTLKARLVEDAGWGYYARDPLAQRIHRALADRFLTPESRLTGAEHLAAIADVPTVIFSNHLSYADANVVDVLLRRAGHDALANRLTALAGPKVFTSRERRFSSLCFGTIKVPQSADVSSGEAVLSAREVARAARESIEVALARLAGGDALLLFGEGSRSRSGAMQAILPGVARYLGAPGACVLPLGLTGPETLFPVSGAALHSARVVARLGRPLSAAALLGRAGGNRRIVVDAIGLAVAELLPPAYRGFYAAGAEHQDALAVLQGARGDG